MAYGNVGKTENKYYAGVSIPRVSRMAFGSASTENRYFRKQYYIAGGYTQKINESFSAQPAVLVSFSGNSPLQANFSGTLYVQDKFGVGFKYRTDNELAALLNFNLNTRLRAAYSYQFGFGATRLGGISVATHEIGFSYRFPLAE
jgi:type IX secretion system PorP/SprF family membrane protein